MSDGLKQYVDRNRDDFELYPYDLEKGWSGVDTTLQTRSEAGTNSKWRYYLAASVVLVVGLAISVIIVSGEEHFEYPTDLMEAQFYYQEMIDAKIHLVRDQLDDPALLQDIEALDMAFTELQADLEEDVQNEEVVAAMIDNYRLKLKILERILEDLEGDDNEKDMDI